MERRGRVESGRKNKGPTITEGEKEGEGNRREENEEEGNKRDLLDQCQTASYAPVID